MTDRVRPSVDAPGNAYELAVTLAQAGSMDGWVVPAGTVYLGDEDPNLTEANFNAFAQTSSGTSLDVTIDAGEAFVHGAWMARDTQTTVTLAASTAAQTVYLGWDKSATDGLIIGLSSAFSADDRKMAIWEFDTDGSGVTASTDKRVQARRFAGSIDANDTSTSTLVLPVGTDRYEVE